MENKTIQSFRYLTILESGGAEVNPNAVRLDSYVELWAGAGVAVYWTTQIGVLGASALLPFCAYRYFLLNRRENEAGHELLAFYAKVKEPIFEFQRAEHDPSVFERAERHRELLRLSKNTLFGLGKISVIEVYHRDPEYDYCESFEEFELRRSDMKKDFLRAWARELNKKDKDWSKSILLGQRGVKLNGSEVLSPA